jgi:diphthamide biosynthesis methyltransferase
LKGKRFEGVATNERKAMEQLLEIEKMNQKGVCNTNRNDVTCVYMPNEDTLKRD